MRRHNNIGRRETRTWLLRHGRSLVLFGGVLLVLVGCGGGDNASSSLRGTQTAQALLNVDATQTALSVTPTPASPPEIGPVSWAMSIDDATGEPTEKVESFDSASRTIYAVIPVMNVVPGTVFTATWTYNDTLLDSLATSVTVQPNESARWVEFHLTRSDDSWPDGQYAIAIRVDSGIVQQSSIAVKN